MRITNVDGVGTATRCIHVERDQQGVEERRRRGGEGTQVPLAAMNSRCHPIHSQMHLRTTVGGWRLASAPERLVLGPRGRRVVSCFICAGVCTHACTYVAEERNTCAKRWGAAWMCCVGCDDDARLPTTKVPSLPLGRSAQRAAFCCFSPKRTAGQAVVG
ncbi:hypothetical protein BC567DRAFT_98285 [Phyllosticta citribraziliensis]